jgi:hypothetical protein
MIISSNYPINTTMSKVTKHRPRFGSFQTLSDINPSVKKKHAPKPREDKPENDDSSTTSSYRSLKVEDGSSSSIKKVVKKKPANLDDRSTSSVYSRPKSTLGGSSHTMKSAKRGRKKEVDGTDKVRSSSLGRLAGARARRKSVDSDDGELAISQAKGSKDKDASMDGSSPNMKSAKTRGRKKEVESEGNGTGKVRSSSVGALRGARARRKSFDNDEDSAGKSPTRAKAKGVNGKDESLDGSSHTMKPTKMRC